MKRKVTLIILCVVVMLTMAACSKETETSPDTTNNAEIANPIVEHAALEEAIETAGFDFAVPDTIDGYGSRKIMTIDKKTIQVVYSGEKERLTVRKAEGNGDISGDYNVYSENNVISVDGIEITLKGNEGEANTAVWADNGYSFSITSEDAMSRDEIIELIRIIK